MATISEITASRATAGARYAAAITEFQAAYADLAGIDAALNNASLAGRNGGPVPTFRGDADRIPWEFRHPVYSPTEGSSLITARDAKRASVLATFSAA